MRTILVLQLAILSASAASVTLFSSVSQGETMAGLAVRATVEPSVEIDVVSLDDGQPKVRVRSNTGASFAVTSDKVASRSPASAGRSEIHVVTVESP